MEISENAIEFLLKSGYNPNYGARPLRRYIEKYISTELSKMIIEGKLHNNQIIFINFLNNKLSFEICDKK